jgi:hypothetical protein
MSAANPNPMEISMVSVLVVANAGGGSPLLCGVVCGGPEEISNGGNKGGQRGKHGRGREEDREEPGMVASEQAGLLDKTM